MSHHQSKELELLEQINQLTIAQTFEKVGSVSSGLKFQEVEARLKTYGHNLVGEETTGKWLFELLKKFNSPLVITLFVVATISYFFGEKTSAIIVGVMAMISIFISFYQEYRAGQNAEKLRELVRVSATVWREGRQQQIKLKNIVPGDVVELTAGNMIPGDLRIIEDHDLFLSQSALTGESFPVEKYCLSRNVKPAGSIYELDTIAFMGSSVVSGMGKGVVISTGHQTEFGRLSAKLSDQEEETAFDKGINKFTMLMIRLIIILSVFIFLVNAIFKGNIIDSLLFALAVAVGLTPDMLPVIVAVNLSKGAQRMAEKKVIIKRLDAIQNFGAMDVLCTDKTGTLTLDEVALVKHCDASGQENENVFRLAYLNSVFQAGLRNLLDRAVVDHGKFPVENTEKIDEVPFDFVRKVMSVIISENEQVMMISKGAPEEIIKRCTSFEQDGQNIKLDKSKLEYLDQVYRRFSEDGFRVLAIATKACSDGKCKFGKEDEFELVFRGYVAFLDPPKPTSRKAIDQLELLGVKLKILSGDNATVVVKICAEVGLPVDSVLLGDDVDKMTDEELSKAVEVTTVFARMLPMSKERVIRTLKKNGRIVGFMGDGINDAPALKAADVGISVDNATDIAKDTADMILLEKDLTVLSDCVKEGRKTFANTLKYIKMGASSNFGNMLSLTVASSFLPFLPMLPPQVLFNNLLYDFSQLSIPADNVDEEYLLVPRPWNIDFIKKFILAYGPISSLFDLLTFGLLWWGFSAYNNPALFQTGWFVESLMTQATVIYVIRTAKIPFLQSRPSLTFALSSTFVVLVACIVPYTPLAKIFGFVALSWQLMSFLIVMTIMYLLLTQAIKMRFIKKYGFN